MDVNDVNTQKEGVDPSIQSHDVQGSKLPKSQSSRSLFVRSLPVTANTETLTEHFSQSYPLKHATVVVDPTSKKSKGYGFVTFVDAEDAQKAKVEFDGSVIQGRRIKVEIAEARQRDSHAIDGQKKSQPSATALKLKADRERQKLEEQKSTKLIVRNLPWSIKDSEQLASLFKSYGKVKYATLPKPKAGLSAGFGFVTLRRRGDAEKALAGVNGKSVDGRTLAVDWAVEKDVWETIQKDNGEGVRLGSEQPTGSCEVGDDGSVKSESSKEDLELKDVPQSDADDVEFSNEDESETSDTGTDTKLTLSQQRRQDNSTTLFIRNLPFGTTDETLQEQFGSFGAVRYARIVTDPATGKSKGTGFICFYNPEDTLSCLQGAPRLQPASALKDSTRKSNGTMPSMKHSLLEDIQADPSGRYTIEGRVLHVSRAVDRGEANRLVVEGNSLRESRDKDKRRFYLLSEGTIPSGSPLYESLAPSEIKMREDSAKQRQSLMKTNPSLHLSLTRLSIRNIPRSISSKDLKALAREAVVGFAKDVRGGRRGPLSREELSRGGGEMREGEKARKSKGKGIVKQAKVVCEGREGGKVSEESGAGRSRGYGFVEYVSHRWALMGLRWLNGRAVGQPQGPAGAARGSNERKKRLIVEFAIENAQVVARRQDREARAREASLLVATAQKEKGEASEKGKKIPSRDSLMAKGRRGMKRKHEDEMGLGAELRGDPSTAALGSQGVTERSEKVEKLARRQQIIGHKRMARKLRRRGRSG